jgi:L-glyceraldehyde 3-phosphate reductase
VNIEDHYVPAEDRYDTGVYRRCGRSGLQLPAVALGLWMNFGDDRPYAASRSVVLRAFDLGITHFDLANNYGSPYGSAERTFGRILSRDLARYRDELVISTKAGYDMWPGPYGNHGSRKYLLASLDQSLKRLGVDNVDIFYSHRFDVDTPLEETMGALDAAVRAGKAIYVGVSSYSAEQTDAAVRLLRETRTPLIVHQASYSLLNRWIEPDLVGVLEREQLGLVAFSALAQGILSDRYLAGGDQTAPIPRRESISDQMLNPDMLERLRGLAGIAQRRGQTLAQMAVAWVLRNPRVTSALLGVSSIEQLEQNLAALDGAAFSDDELRDIDRYAEGADVNRWKPPGAASSS